MKSSTQIYLKAYLIQIVVSWALFAICAVILALTINLVSHFAGNTSSYSPRFYAWFRWFMGIAIGFVVFRWVVAKYILPQADTLAPTTQGQFEDTEPVGGSD